MRILIAQTFLHLPQETGGAPSNTHHLCQSLRALGMEVSVLAGLRRNNLSPAWLFTSADRGLVDRRLGYPVQRARDPVSAAALICRTAPPTIAFVQSGDMAALCRVFLEANVPTIAFFQDASILPSAGEYAPHPLLHCVACSRSLAERVRERLGVEVTVLPVLIDPSAYRTETERRVATFVNPVPRKGVEIVLALAAYRPDIPFEFVESWHLRHRVFALLQSRAAHHGNIRLLRHTDDMRTIYRRSRIVLAPSLCGEAWGRIVSEAQVSGIPAIVSDSGGLPEAVGDGGIVVGRHAPIADWLSALSRLWDNSAEYERYVKRALAHAARPEFQPQQVVRTLLQLVEQHRGSHTP